MDGFSISVDVPAKDLAFTNTLSPLKGPTQACGQDVPMVVRVCSLAGLLRCRGGLERVSAPKMK